MPYQFSLDIANNGQDFKVEASHFGLNFVADFERIGTKGWESFDEVVEQMGVTSIRYPGGVTAEKGFDITDPNASTIVLSDGSSRRMLGAYDFGTFCVENGYSASYIIPTDQLLVVSSSTGKLVFDPAYEQYIIDFVFGTMLATSGTVTMYEIGNEYESYMTSQEYGALADAVAPLIQAGVDLYVASYGPVATEPDIAIQVWSQNSNETGSLQTSDLAKRADAVFTQLTPTSASLIDTVVTHWYLKDKAKTYEQVYSTIEKDIQESIAILHKQSDLFGGDVNIVVSEYNVNQGEIQFFGMAQIPVLIKMFAEFVQAGVDQLDFWSAQYQTTSFALDDGTLTVVGATVSYLSDILPGLEPIDVETGSSSVGAIFFFGDDVSVLAISSISAAPQDFSFVFSQPGTTYCIVEIGYVTADTSKADGTFKSYSGLAIYNEPDLAGEIVWSDSQESLDEFLISLDSYQTVFIEVVNIAPDLQTDSSGVQYYTFQDSSNGVSVWLSEDYIGSGGFAGFFYFQPGIMVECTPDSDWVVVNSGYAEVNMGAGDDDLEVYSGAYGSFSLKDGDDSAVIFSSDTFVYGGKGSDEIWIYGSSTVTQGGQGNDLILASADNTTIVYGIADGEDTVTSIYSDTLTLNFGENAQSEFQDGQYIIYETAEDVVLDFFNGGSITFVDLTQEALMASIYRGSNVLVGSSGHDTFAGYEGNDSLYGGGGCDFLDGGTDADTMGGGFGNDTYVVDNAGDRVVEEAAYTVDGGIDQVKSSVNYALGRMTEILILQGDADIDGTGRIVSADALLGNSGSNQLLGLGGSDWINGEAGDDVLIGGEGRDWLVGAAGEDRFVFRGTMESGLGWQERDLIRDFRHNEDTIDLRMVDANTLIGGDQAFEYIGSAEFSGTGASSAGEMRGYNWNGRDFILLEMDVNGDGAADMSIFVNGTNAMSASDFLL